MLRCIILLNLSLTGSDIIAVDSSPKQEFNSETNLFQRLLDRVELRLGLALGTYEMTITEKTTNDSGTFQNQRGFIPHFSIGFGTSFIGDSNFGHGGTFGVASFRFSEQKISGENVDLGSSARGLAVHVTPTIFYQFGGHKLEDPWHLRAVLGLGLGYLRTKGNIYLNNSANPRMIDFDIKSEPLSVSAAFGLQYRIHDWEFGLSASGPLLSNNEYKADFIAGLFSIDYIFTF